MQMDDCFLCEEGLTELKIVKGKLKLWSLNIYIYMTLVIAM